MRVLVTGATGYIGSRLIPELLARGHEVVAGSRRAGRDGGGGGGGLGDYAWGDQVEPVYLDVEDTVSVHLAAQGVDAVVYLVHSMAGGPTGGGFVQKDREAAQYVADACRRAGVGRIVYLSGLVPPGRISAHLRSRLEVEEVLMASGVPTTTLRAAMVIGGGSLSFELMRRLTERVPVTPVPSWMRRSIQPIAVEDVVFLLARALEGKPRNVHYDIGGDEVLTYEELLAEFADLVGLVRTQVVVPFVPVQLVGEVVAAVSGIPRHTVKALIESLSYDMVCSERSVRRTLARGHTFLGVREAMVRSLAGQTDATSYDGDIQGEAVTDPDWVGGIIDLASGAPRLGRHSLVQGLLLGARRPAGPG